MPNVSIAALVSVVVPVCVQFVLFLRWLHRRTRDDEIVRACVRDVALQHLPHIYDSLRRIASEQGITLDPPPLVHYVDFELGKFHRGAGR